MKKAVRKPSFGRSLGEWVVRWRWLVMLGCLAVTAGVATGASRLTFDNNYRVFFSKENPELKAFEAMQRIYSKNDNILFVIVPGKGKVFEPRILEAIEKLTKAAWKIPFSRRVDSITNYQFSRAVGDDLIVADLIKKARSLTPAEIASRRLDALSEPALKGRLIRTKSDVTGVSVTLQLPDSSPVALTQAVAAARKLARRIEAETPGLTIRMTGTAMLGNAFAESSITDGMTLIPLMFAVLLLVIGIMLRSFTGVLGVVMIIGMSVAVAMGAAGYMGIALTPPSAAAPTIIMTLAVADSIHFLVTMFHEMRHGAAKRAAVIESLRINLQPIVLTSVTTAIGFLSMNSSDAPPFRDLGNITAVGIMAALFFSLLFLPALMSVLPVRVRQRDESKLTVMDRLANLVIARRRTMLYGMSALILILFSFIPRIELNDQFVKYFDSRVQFRVDTDFSVANLTGIYQVEYSIPAGSSAGINEPSYLRNLEKFSNWLRRQPEVLHTSTLTDTMKRLNRNMHGDDKAWYKLPDTRRLAAQYLLLFEMSLPFGLDLNDQINVDKSATRVVATLKDMSARAMREFETRSNEWIAVNLPARMKAKASGAGLMFSHISERNISSMLGGTLIALVLISGILIVAFRNVRIGLISLIPNLVPAGMGFGVWAIVVGEVGMSVAVVAAMTLGIVVDDTIHFLSKYLRARRERGASPEEAVRYAFATVGKALAVMTLVLIAGFLVLAGSSFAINADMGLMTALTIAIALMVDFLFLPPLLMKLEEKKHAASIAAAAEAARS